MDEDRAILKKIFNISYWILIALIAFSPIIDLSLIDFEDNARISLLLILHTVFTFGIVAIWVKHVEHRGNFLLPLYLFFGAVFAQLPSIFIKTIAIGGSDSEYEYDNMGGYYDGIAPHLVMNIQFNREQNAIFIVILFVIISLFWNRYKDQRPLKDIKNKI